MKKTICLIIYYGFARFLPKSHSKPFGFIGKNLRYFLCYNIFEYCGKNVNIEKGAHFGRGHKIKIGDNSGIGVNCRIHNNTVIGKNVMMGPEFRLLASKHIFERTDISMLEQGKTERPEPDCVVIEDDVWIGREVLVIGSQTIKKGSIVGARALLTKSFPEYSIVGGIPAKLIRMRK